MDGAPTAYRIVPITEATAEAFHGLGSYGFLSAEPRPADEGLAALDLTRCFAASPTGAEPFAGIYGSFDMLVTIPVPDGLRPVPMAGLTWVVVHPDHRRRGVLTQLIRHHFDDLHQQGVALSGLHASEPPIYGRFGYSVASLEASLGLSRGSELRGPGLDEAAASVRTRMTPFAGEGVAKRVHELHVELSARQLGAPTRSESHTLAESRDFLPWRRDSEAAQVLFAERNGSEVGYAILQRSSKWEDGRPQGSVTCHEMVAADSAALLAMARRLVDFDLTSSVTLETRSLDDPVLWWAGGPRGATVKVYDALWLRLIDVGAALSQRGYAAPVDLVLDVEDSFCPWNQGRWRLHCDGPGSAAGCERTDDEPGLRLPVQALASAYVGLRSIAAQQQGGGVTELTPGAVSRLSAAMATPTSPVAAVPF